MGECFTFVASYQDMRSKTVRALCQESLNLTANLFSAAGLRIIPEGRRSTFYHALSFNLLPFYDQNRGSNLLTRIMGTGKKEANRKVRQGKTGDGMANVKIKGENFYR